jgi:PAS domain S-box-containing protein
MIVVSIVKFSTAMCAWKFSMTTQHGTPLNELPVDRRFQLLVDGVSDYAIYMLTPEGMISSWNTGAQRFKGYVEAEVISTHFSRFYTEEDRARQLPKTALEVAAKEGRFENEGWRVRKDGSRFWANVVIDAIRDEFGNLIGFAKVTRDITERKAAQEALRASEERFRLLVQGVTDYAIYMLSPSGEITNWNAGAQRIKGYTEDEVIGTYFSRFYTEEDRIRKLPERALEIAAKEGRYESEGWRVRKDGSRFLSHVIIDAIHDAFGNLAGFAKITRDITQKRQAEEDRARAEQFQSQKIASLGKLTGGIAHDFNNLLAVVVNGMELLTSEVRSPNGVKVLESMKRAADRGATLTRQLLAYARQQPLRQGQCNLNQVIAGFEAVLRQACRPGTNFHLNLAPTLNDTLLDAQQFEATLLNLVVNARDAISDMGVVSVTTENLTLGNQDEPVDLPPGHYVKVTVRDTGAGMAPEVAEQAFEPFFTTKPVGKGTGMGLSQVYGFVKQSGGEVTLESQEGNGTTISLYLPGIATQVNEVHEPETATVTEKVLVVEDEPDLLETTIELFRAMDYEVLSATNGRNALEVLEKTRGINILFTDVIMPGGVNGIELARATQRLYPHIKVILASGYALPALKAEHGGLDEFAFINKPYRFSELAKQLRSAM